MINIEDLVKQIIVSPLFKSQIQIQLKECIQDYNESPRQTSNPIALPELVDEINGYIAQITEIALEEENSKNYITFMKKNGELCLEMEKRINARIQSSVQQLDSKMQTMTLKFNELIKNTKKAGGEAFRLKDERKMITQSILETSRLQNASNTFSTIHNSKSQVHFGKETNSYDQLPESNDTNSSLSMELEKIKFAEIEKQCKKCLQAWWVKVQSALEGFKKNQQKIQQECTQLSGRAQSKLQGNLESLWNVISDLCSRISKFESMEFLYQSNQA